MVAAGVDDAEAVACRSEVERELFNDRFLRVLEVDRDESADSARGLIHQTGGLAEEDVLGVLRDLRDLGVLDLAVVVEAVEYETDHVLESGGGRESGALEDVGGGVSVIAADLVAVLEEAAAHTGDYRLRGVVEVLIDGRIGDVDLVDREAFGLDVDVHIAARRSCGDDVEVDGSCEHLAVVVVGVVAGDLASASDREKGYLAVGAE